MQFTTATTLAIFGFISSSTAHMIMSAPVPFGKSSLTNSPLDAAGADFPCKQRTGVYDKEGASNSMALGSTQPLTFIGGASHGGGSCQVSITYDSAPTKDSVWKVIHSIEGGCPVKNQAGNIGTSADAADPDTYSFTVPTSLPTGDAVLAWTWFNKVGNREMYMNCAPVTLTGGSSKRTIEEDNLVANMTQLVQRDTAAYDSLPDMFVANIGNGCNTVDSTDVLFPNAGDSVEQDGLSTKSALSTPTGTGCAAAVAGSVSATAGGGSASTSATASAGTTAAPSSAPASSIQGGVFITTGAATSASAIASTLVTSAATSAPAVASSVAASSAAPAATASSSSSAGASGVQSGACTDEGSWNCISGTEFQRCASGQWSVTMEVAAGTTCGSSGIETNMNVVASAKRRALRNVHVRRHVVRAT